MLTDCLFCLFQEIKTLIADTPIQIIMHQKCNVLIDRKCFCDLPVKNEEEACEKIIEMSNNNDYATGNVLDFCFFKNNYRLIAIDLSKQTKLKDPQQISFIGKLLRNTEETMFFIIAKSEETTFNFSLNFVTII